MMVLTIRCVKIELSVKAREAGCSMPLLGTKMELVMKMLIAWWAVIICSSSLFSRFKAMVCAGGGEDAKMAIGLHQSGPVCI